jgi:hypothetical protein
MVKPVVQTCSTLELPFPACALALPVEPKPATAIAAAVVAANNVDLRPGRRMLINRLSMGTTSSAGAREARS